MKKIFAAFYLSLFTVINCFGANINVAIFGDIVEFPDQKAQIINNRTYVPARGVFENFGYDVNWNSETKTVILSSNYDDTAIMLKQNATDVVLYHNYSNSKINATESYSEIIKIENPPIIVNGRIMLPLRAITEISGFNVEWDEDTRTANITSDLDTRKLSELSDSLRTFLNKTADFISDETGYTLKPEYSYAQGYFDKFVNLCNELLTYNIPNQNELDRRVKILFDSFKNLKNLIKID